MMFGFCARYPASRSNHMLTGKILKLAGWPEGRLIGLAKAAAEALDPLDEARDTTVARLAAVRAEPGAFLPTRA